MANFHTEEEENIIRLESTIQLAKRNNRFLNSALVYSAVEEKLKSDECYDIVRDELFQRGFLSSREEKRLIDGKEIN